MKLTTQTVILCSRRLYSLFILPKLTCGNDEYVIYILVKCFLLSVSLYLLHVDLVFLIDKPPCNIYVIYCKIVK